MSDETKQISLSPDGVAIVDAKDFEWLSQWRWRKHTSGHVMRLQRDHYYQHGIYMHRLIIGAEKGQVVDHINGNKLDNRRANLRLCTQGQNRKNSVAKTNSASRFKGVSWDKRRNKWKAEIRTNGKCRFLGYFTNEEEAARAYDTAHLERDGEFARLNFANIQEDL